MDNSDSKIISRLVISIVCFSFIGKVFFNSWWLWNWHWIGITTFFILLVFVILIALEEEQDKFIEDSKREKQ